MTTINGSSGNDTLSGTRRADSISGGGGNDTISAGGGNDTVYAGDGNDKVYAGDGNDKVYAGNGNDFVDGGSGNDWIDGGSGNDSLFGGSGNDTILGGDGKDTIDGGSGNDVLDGGSGNDVIDGGSGKDVIIGGAGADTLTGGSGKDAFVYLDASDSSISSWDRITDFTQGQDKIDLSALLGRADLAWGNKTALVYGVWYQNSGSSTFVYADTTGNGEADLKIELKNTSRLTLTSSDFIGVNNSPVAVADTASGTENQTLTIDVLANDRGSGNDGQNDFHDHDHDDDDDDDRDDHDEHHHHGHRDDHDGHVFTLVSVAPTSKGMASVENNQMVFNPGTDFDHLAQGDVEHVTLTYTMRDEHGAQSSSTVDVAVTGTNDAPVAVDVSTVATEDGAAVTADFSADDVDSDDDGASLTYTIVAGLGAGEGSVVNNGDGTFTFNPGADFQDLAQGEEREVTFTYQATDSHHADSGTQTATITVTGVNDAPVITSDGSGDSANVVVAENTTAVADVNATDVDHDHKLTFSKFGGADEAKFSIDKKTGVLTFNAAPDFENPTDVDENNTYDVIVQVSDEHGATDLQSIAVTITDINEQPNAGAAFAVGAAEGVADTVVLADVNATDPDSGGGNDGANDFEDLTYSITGGNGAGLFEINPATGEISLAAGQMLDFEAARQHVLTVRATDGPRLSDETQVTINVTDVNEQPNAGADFAVSAAENVDAATVITTVTGTDPDTGGGNDSDNDFENLSYAIFSDLSGKFEIDSTTGGISLASGQSLDFEAAQSHVVTVRVSDGPGLFDDVDVTINVTRNRLPVANDDSVITNVSITELEGFNIPEWALLANDSDPDGNPIDVQEEVDDVFPATGGFAKHTPDPGTDGFVRFTGLGPESGSFSYRATDGAPSILTANVTVAEDRNGNSDLDGTPGDVDEILVGTDNDGSRIVGGGGNDILIGGNNTSLGDTLDGGSGNDILSGGLGDDVFKFSFDSSSASVTSGDGFDTIVDFEWGMDKLEFNGLGSPSLGQFKQLFDVTETDVFSDGVMDTVVALSDNSWGVTLLGVSGHTEADFYGSSIFS